MAIHSIKKHSLSWFHKTNTGSVIFSSDISDVIRIEISTAAEFSVFAAILNHKVVKYDDETEEIFSN